MFFFIVFVAAVVSDIFDIKKYHPLMCAGLATSILTVVVCAAEYFVQKNTNMNVILLEAGIIFLYFLGTFIRYSQHRIKEGAVN